MSRLFVGNLPYTTTDEHLSQLFSKYGKVVSAQVMKYHDTGRSRGFAFVEMSSRDEAGKAKEALHNSDFGGRSLKVNDAHDKRSGTGS